MDYEVFLVSRMREEYVHGAEPTHAVVQGFRHSGRVVTAAAVIMVSVFSGFLLDDEVLIKSIGLGLAAAVFFDAFVVRMTIVPAVMALLGHRSWALPKWLDRILPDVDVEGEKLRHVLEAEKGTEQEAEQTDSAPEPVLAGVAAGVHTGSDDQGAPRTFTGVPASDDTESPAPAQQVPGKTRGLSRLKQRLAREASHRPRRLDGVGRTGTQEAAEEPAPQKLMRTSSSTAAVRLPT
jgi:RND superfamily putative drug exporter